MTLLLLEKPNCPGLYVTIQKEVADRLVAAYIVGYSVTGEWLMANPTWTFATGADDTGVVISWNTEAAGFSGTNPVVLPGALVINPVSWTRDETAAPASMSRGSLLPDGSRRWARSLSAAACSRALMPPSCRRQPSR